MINLNQRIKIQTQSETVSSTGQRTKAWTDVGTRYCSITPLSGREFERAQKMQAEVSHEIIMRFTTLTTKHRLVFGSRIFNILSVLNKNEKNKELNILAKEIV